MRTAHTLVAALSLAALALPPAWANAPEPVKNVSIPAFMGRWNEILRTPNARQKDCYAAYQIWSWKKDATFAISQHCHQASPTGRETSIGTGARSLNPPANTKFEASFFGGVIKKKYWVIDHADDYSWMIASSEDGKFASLLARAPGLPKAQIAALKARMKALGFDTAKLEHAGAVID